MAKVTRRKLIEEKIAWLENIKIKTKEQVEELVKLKESLIKSKRGKSSKVKGASYERKIAKKFKESYDIDLVRTPQSGGFAKKSTKADEFRGDITSVDKSISLKLHIECKDHKTWSLKQWINQAKEDCPKDKIPVVVMHQSREIEEGKVSQENDDYVIFKLEDFLKLVPKEAIIERKEV